jgi:uncharacterized protein (TIGR03083 family)
MVLLMDRDEIWAAIDDQRRRLVDLLNQLSDEEWSHPSLCDGWTVRDVASHLTLAQGRLPEALLELARGGFAMKRAIRVGAIRRSGRPATQIVAEIGGMIGSRRHIQGLTCRETLIDILVHSQDIAVPLGRTLPMQPLAAAEAATRVWRSGYPFWARRRFLGFRLSATDVDWAYGHGQPVTAPMSAILLLLTGRNVALPDVAGEGAMALVDQLSSV